MSISKHELARLRKILNDARTASHKEISRVTKLCLREEVLLKLHFSNLQSRSKFNIMKLWGLGSLKTLVNSFLYYF